MKSKTFLVIGIFFLLFFGWYVYIKFTPGKYDDFAHCLESQGALFYGAWWCPHCKEQKTMFGKSAKYLPYIECTVGGTRQQSEVCDKENIRAFPTWIFADGEKKEGVLSLTYLSQKTNCDIQTGKVFATVK
ncbi:thioredoxin family protein [Candidatus Woesearchaeota archaeon]|nr:thioredoxin family protein [Candidatus Woesearchaeota archaeon]